MTTDTELTVTVNAEVVARVNVFVTVVVGTFSVANGFVTVLMSFTFVVVSEKSKSVVVSSAVTVTAPMGVTVPTITG